MDEDNGQKSLLFTLTYLLLKRRRDLNIADTERRNEIQRRLRLRQYSLQRQKRSLMMLLAQSTGSCSCPFPTRVWTRIENTDWWERVAMREFQPSDWLEKFRMSKDTFFFLCGKLKLRLSRQDTQLRAALPVEKRVAIALWRLATNVGYRTISKLFGVGRSTVCKCVREVCHAVVVLLKPLYLCPPSEQELEDAAKLFQTRWGFPHCIGVLGTLHVPIIAPSSNTDSYWNSQGWFSVVVQAAVNGLGHFWDVCAVCPGGTEQAAILQNSTLWGQASEGGLTPTPPKEFMGRPLGYLMLGDAGYPLCGWLLKCYPDSPQASASQRSFNKRLVRAHGVLERTLWRLRARWQCLHKRNDCGMDVIPTMVLACCILHNMCEVHGDTLVEEWMEEVRQEEGVQPVDILPQAEELEELEQEGEDVRRLYCQYFQEQEQEQALSLASP